MCASKDAVFVARLTEQGWHFLGGKVELIVNVQGEKKNLHPSAIKRIMVTDRMQPVPFEIQDPSNGENTLSL